MSIEQDLNRIAIALEKIAEHLEESLRKPVEGVPPARMKEVGMPAQQEAERPQGAGLKPEEVEKGPGGFTHVKEDRALLMSECDRLNLPYPAKASVKRLKEILETYGKKGAQLPLTTAAPAAAETTTEVKQYTKPEAKEILMRFAAKYGMDKAMKVITDFGQKDLSGVEAAGKLNELVEKTLKLEADHGKK